MKSKWFYPIQSQIQETIKQRHLEIVGYCNYQFIAPDHYSELWTCRSQLGLVATYWFHVIKGHDFVHVYKHE